MASSPSPPTGTRVDGEVGRRCGAMLARWKARRPTQTTRRHALPAASTKRQPVPAARRVKGAARHPASLYYDAVPANARAERAAEDRPARGHGRRGGATAGGGAVSWTRPNSLGRSGPAETCVWGICSGPATPRAATRKSVVFKYGMKRDFNAWLRSLGNRAPVKTLAELRAWNRARESTGTLKYGQAQLDNSDEMDLVADKARYEADRAKDVRITGPNGIDAALKQHTLDALLFPGPLGAALAARPGYPSIVVPFGLVPVPETGFPAGFAPQPSPFGVTFTGTACSEPRLIELAYAFEQATKRRQPPGSSSSRRRFCSKPARQVGDVVRVARHRAAFGRRRS